VTVQLSEPLPECLACETPTRRDVHARTGGFCSACDPSRPYSKRPTSTTQEQTR